MKKIIFIFLLFVFQSWKSNAQCTCNYSFTGTTDTLSFTNLSVISNAHYYWNFGDGQTDYAYNPVHIFPESGRYRVTLFGLDTISNCHTYYETWIQVHKPTTDLCNAGFTDSVTFNGGIYYIVPYDSSANCGMYNSNYDVANCWSCYSGMPLYQGNYPRQCLYIGRVKFSTHDSINGYVLKRAYYKTIPYNYSSSKNYDSCSANFEYHIDYQATGAMVYFKAMNSYVTNYRFAITGFGSPIYLNSSSASYLYPYMNMAYYPNLIVANSEDASGCRDTVSQEILIKNPNYVIPPSCDILSNPQSHSALEGSNTFFYIATTSPLLTKKWQQDAGLGWTTLTNAGPFNGVNTDTLTISNVQLTMNNYHYRCVLSNVGGSNCHNTSTEAILNILIAGVNDIYSDNLFTISPNPFTSATTISFNEPQKNTTIKITDILGKEIITLSGITGKEVLIEKGTMKAGIYFVEVTSAGSVTARKKIMVQ